MSTNSIVINKEEVLPGQTRNIRIPIAAMATHQDLDMMVHVVNGKKPGPVLFVSAAIHGDEINGVEIIRRLIRQKQIERLSGTLIAIPIVNVHGFVSQSRYLPDGRDLNRSFPGSSKGSLAGRMAHTFLNEIVAKCSHGIDLHTGARHRDNLPQVRADLSQDEVKDMASRFGVPVIIDSKIRDGSLREAGGDAGIPILLYEAGEALRFDEVCIRAGVRGVLNVMREIGMLTSSKKRPERVSKKAIISSNTSWVRAPYSGILRSLVKLGAQANKGSVLGVVADPLGQSEYKVVAPEEGIVIGCTNMPLVYEGDALFHIAYYQQKVGLVVDQVEQFQGRIENTSNFLDKDFV